MSERPDRLKDKPLTVGMLLDALASASVSILSPHTGWGGADEYVTVVNHDALLTALEKL